MGSLFLPRKFDSPQKHEFARPFHLPPFQPMYELLIFLAEWLTQAAMNSFRKFYNTRKAFVEAEWIYQTLFLLPKSKDLSYPIFERSLFFLKWLVRSNLIVFQQEPVFYNTLLYLFILLQLFGTF